MVVAPPKATEAVSQVRDALRRTDVPLHAVWHVAHDPKGAGFFRGQVTGRADRTLLVRSARRAADELAAAVAPFFRESATEAESPQHPVDVPHDPDTGAAEPAGIGQDQSARGDSR
jgi:hypothetical protein